VDPKIGEPVNWSGRFSRTNTCRHPRKCVLRSQARINIEIEIEIVGEAADFAQTIRMTRDLDPQVVILDLHMPDEKNVSPQEVKSHLNRGTQAISLSNDQEVRRIT
jgi:DNA-binding NarL/FixJ family response regulator